MAAEKSKCTGDSKVIDIDDLAQMTPMLTRLSSDDPMDRWAARFVLKALAGETEHTRRGLGEIFGKLWPRNWFQRK